MYMAGFIEVQYLGLFLTLSNNLDVAVYLYNQNEFSGSLHLVEHMRALSATYKLFFLQFIEVKVSFWTEKGQKMFPPKIHSD